MIFANPDWQPKPNNQNFFGFLRFYDFEVHYETSRLFFDLHISYSREGLAHLSLYEGYAEEETKWRVNNWYKCCQESQLTILNNTFSINQHARKTFEQQLSRAISKKADWNSDEYWQFVQDEGTKTARKELGWIFGAKFQVKRKVQVTRKGNKEK